MKKLSSMALILLCGICLALPAQAQRKFFEPGEGGLTVAATYKSMSAFIDNSSSSGFGLIADYSSSGTISLGLETVWREQGDDYPNTSYESPSPDITPFIALQLLGRFVLHRLAFCS